MKNITKIVVASHNEGKVSEIRDLLAPFGVKTVSAGELGLPEPEETETTFIGNAELKARAAAESSGLPALSDDSGLAVDALNGDPGIYAARWAEKPSSKEQPTYQCTEYNAKPSSQVHKNTSFKKYSCRQWSK